MLVLQHVLCLYLAELAHLVCSDIIIDALVIVGGGRASTNYRGGRRR
jgi:hypothetical protein